LWRRPRPELGCGAKERRRRYIFPCSTTLRQVNVKGKVVLVLFITQHHAMKAYWGVEVYLQVVL
jgi:hypothetical protein